MHAGTLLLQATEMLKSWRHTFSLSGTVLQNVSLWCQIVVVTVYEAVIVCLHQYVQGLRMEFPQTLITVLGFVTGLLLVFRTNTAYDRFWEGRKLWSSITHNVRTLIRHVLAVVEEKDASDLVEKLTIVNLLVAFSFALKNYLREDYSYESEDLRDLLRPLPRLTHSKESTTACHERLNGFSTGQNNPTLFTAKDDPVLVTVSKTTARPQNSNESNYCPRDDGFRRGKWRAHAKPAEANIPLEILIYVESYLNKLARQEKPVPVTFLNTMNTSLTSLSDAVSGVERILQTPIPLAYAVHLRHTVWIYLVTLPYQLVGLLNWWTIPAVAFATFALLGILHIGKEIENPFGMDANDLPLDEICERIKHEAHLAVGNPIVAPSTWIMSKENQPLVPFDNSTALDLSDKSLEEVRHLLISMTATACEKVKTGGI